MPEVAKQPLLEGKTFRVDIENWGIPRDATASDVVRFEETELGNKYDLSDSLLKELDNYSHSDVVWVTKKSIDAEYYLSEGMTKKDIREITLPEGSRIIAEDGQGGHLVLRGDAKPEVAIPKAESIKCQQALDSPIKCYDFLGSRRFAACRAWQLIEETKIGWQEAISKAWEEIKEKCTWN